MIRSTPHDPAAAADLIDLQAAQWLCALAEGDPAQRPAFVAWLKQSPRHVQAFLLTSAVWKGLDRAGPSDKGDIARLIEQARSAPRAEIIPLQSSAAAARQDAGKQTNQPRRWLRPAALAASVALAVLGLAWFAPSMLPGSGAYSTAMGEQRTVRLSDGSVVYLNALSRMRVEYSAGGRDIELTRGEAIFKVEHDHSRPFRVHTGDATVQALGTQFNVYRRQNGTTVSVLEGAVQVSAPNTALKTITPRKLAAGEEAHVTAGAIVQRDRADVQQAAAWRERRLVFNSDRLEDIAGEFGRYSPRRLVLADAATRDKRITGTFDADDPASLVLFLRKLDEFDVQITAGGFLIRQRPLVEKIQP